MSLNMNHNLLLLLLDFSEGHEAIQADVVSPSWVYANGQFTNPNPSLTNETPILATPTMSLTDMILANPTELANLKLHWV